MSFFKWNVRLSLCALALALLPGCESKQVDFEAVSFDQLTPEQQQRMRQLEEEARRAAASGQPMPPDAITEDMLTSGLMIDGVLVTQEQMDQMQ